MRGEREGTTKMLVCPGNQGFGSAIAVVVYRLVRGTGREELERWESFDIETVAQLALRICINLSNDQRWSGNE